MSRLAAVLARAREWFGARRLEADLDDELQHHLDLLTDDYVREGRTRDEARRLAAHHLGGLDQTKELVRERRGFPSMTTFLTDIRYGIRRLMKARGFTTVAVLTLALGIGVNTAIFSIVNAVMLQPLPYADPDRLVSLWEAHVGAEPANMTTRGFVIGDGVDDPGRSAVAPANLVDYRARAVGFTALAGLGRASVTLTGAGTPEQLIGEEVTPNYFAVLGVPPAKGRPLHEADAGPAGSAAVVLSDALWRDRFGADEDIIGKRLTMNDQAHEVVGVMPPGFQGVSHFGTSQTIAFWTAAYYPPDLLANHADHEINVIGRLAPTATLTQAQSSLTGVSLDLAQRFPQSNDTIRAFVRPLGDDVSRRVRTSLIVLMSIVGLILLIACVNVAHLVMVRGAGRQREIAIRFALGASRRRVLTEMLAESLVLATMSAVAGLVLGYWVKGFVSALAPAAMTQVGAVRFDWRVLVFTACVGLATALAFGVLPAWQARRSKPADALKATERSVSGRHLMRWRNVLMVLEVALSTILLVGAGLMVRSLAALTRVELGFRTDHVMAMNVNLPERRYKTADDRLRFFEELETELQRVPGVRSIAFANRFPMRGGWESGFGIEGVTFPGDGSVTAPFQAVSPGFFDTLGVRLIAGRLLGSSDRKGSEAVAVVSEAFSTKLLAGASPIGRRLRRGSQAPWITIVGVVADTRRDGKTAAIAPQVYLPAAQTGSYPVRLGDVAVYADTDPVALAAAMRQAAWTVDKDQPVSNIRTLEDVVAAGAQGRRFQAALFGVFAVLALVLALVGIHGVVSYAVAQRTPEIGLRVALGANPSAILSWLLAEAATFVAIGAVLGVAGALAVSRFVETLLFQVTPTDPATYALAAGLLTVVSLLTSAVAARRATRIDPIRALRWE